MPSRLPLAAVCCLAVVAAGTAYAQPISESTVEQTPAPTPGPFTFGAYVEAYYQWNVGQPSNGITNFRAFDSRHNTFTISNAVLDALWDSDRVIGRLALQVGSAPSSTYAGEPRVPGTSTVNASDGDLWKYIQQAYGGYRFDFDRDVTVTGGIFMSPFGPESAAVKDNWNWSRSNLFFAMPAYFTGVRATTAITETWAFTLAGYNGWNSVVDNNSEKSVAGHLTYTREDLALSVLYLGGVERSRGAPEGRAWRHAFDANVMWHATSLWSFIAHINGGFEPNRFGVSSWVAGALYARFKIAQQWFVAARADIFYEHVPENALGRAEQIFWNGPWVSSGTVTLDYRPRERVSFRLEYRHDQSADAMYFGGSVTGDGITAPYVPNRTWQNTLTLGVTSWF